MFLGSSCLVVVLGFVFEVGRFLGLAVAFVGLVVVFLELLVGLELVVLGTSFVLGWLA